MAARRRKLPWPDPKLLETDQNDRLCWTDVHDQQ